MAYLVNGEGNGVLRLATVKWSNDYKHVMRFANKSTRDAWFTNNNNTTLISSTYVFINPNSYIDVNKHIKDIQKFNYAYFTNDTSIDSATPQAYCCFITDWNYIAPNCTRIFLELDVIQTYLYDCTFYRSFIERAHTPNDNLYEWTAPEPISFKPEFSDEIQADTNDWSVAWLLNSISKPLGSNNFDYGGMGSSENMTGCFSWALVSHQDLDLYIQEWAQGSTDHRQDILNITAIPTWLLNAISQHQTGALIESNQTLSTTFSATIPYNALANGYVPRNKKLYTSLCRCFAVYNKNGLSKTIVPELITDYNSTTNTSSLTVTIKAKPIGLTNIKLSINHYNGDINENFNFPYYCQIPVGYNANSGVSASIDKMNSVFNAIGSVAGSVSSIPTSATSKGGAIAGGIIAGANISMTGITTGISLAQAFEDRAGGQGGSSDTLGITPEFIKPRIVEINPLPQDCAIADDFLDTYGYQIDELKDINNFIHNRAYWNYLKTQNVNLSIPAPSKYEQKFKDILNAGVTFWHSYNDFGDYSKTNSIVS